MLDGQITRLAKSSNQGNDMKTIKVSEYTTMKVTHKKGSRVELSIGCTHPIAGGGYSIILSNENVSDLICVLQNKKKNI